MTSRPTLFVITLESGRVLGAFNDLASAVEEFERHSFTSASPGSALVTRVVGGPNGKWLCEVVSPGRGWQDEHD